MDGGPNLNPKPVQAGNLLDQIADAILVVRADRFTYLNRAALAMFRAGSPAELVGEFVNRWLAPTDLDSWHRAAATAGVAHASVPLRWRRVDASEFLSHACLAPYDGPDGRGLCVTLREDVAVSSAPAGQDVGASVAEASAARIYDAIEKLPVGIALFDTDERLIVANKAYMAMPEVVSDLCVPGSSLAEILDGALERGLFHADMGPKEAIRRRRLGNFRKPPATMEFHYPDGRWRNFLDFSMQGGGHVVLSLDITENKAAEARLRQADDILRNIHGHLSAWIFRWTSSPGGRRQVEYAVGALREAFGLPQILAPTEARQLIRQRVDPVTAKHLNELMVKSERTLEPYEVEFSLISRSGERRWLRSQVDVNRLEDGTIAWDGIVIDMTERHRLEQELKASERRFATLAEESSQAIIVHRDFRILYANPAAAEMFGHGRRGPMLAGADFLDLFPEEERDRLQRIADARRQGLETAKHHVVRGRSREADERWLSKRSFTIEWDGVPAVCVTLFDITESRDMERQARQHLETLAQMQRVQMMGELAAGIAHEIGQPLLNIKTYAEGALQRLARGNGHAEGLEDALQRIGDQASLAGEIVRNVRSFVRPDTGETSVVDLGAVLAEVVRLIEVETRDAGIEVDITEAGGLPVMGSVVGLEQVFLNLMRNAVDAIREVGRASGTIRVSAAEGADGVVEIRVADNGAGLPDRLVNRIFDRFVTTKPEGLGLGLAICRSIVESFGGRISVQSSLDRGTTFLLVLRAAPTASSGLAAAAHREVVRRRLRR